jgi:hypothetical protein
LPQSRATVFEDLKIHSMLGEITVLTQERLFGSWRISNQPFAWRLLGLSSGYTSSDSLFDTYKQQLYIAIESLPTTCCDMNPSIGSTVHARTGCVIRHSVANRQVHRSTILLLQNMRRDWTQLRWYHGVQVVRRWIEHLEIVELKEAVNDREKRKAGQGEPVGLTSCGPVSLAVLRTQALRWIPPGVMQREKAASDS